MRHVQSDSLKILSIIRVSKQTIILKILNAWNRGAQAHNFVRLNDQKLTNCRTQDYNE